MKLFKVLSLCLMAFLMLTGAAWAACQAQDCINDEPLEVPAAQWSSYKAGLVQRAAALTRADNCPCPAPAYQECKQGFANVGTQLCEDGVCNQTSGTSLMTPGSYVAANFRECSSPETGQPCKDWAACTNCKPN